MKASDFLFEGLNTPVIVVDVQPEYSGIHDGDENPVFEEIIRFVNRQTGPVLMFVNAEDAGMSGDTVADIKLYWEHTIQPPQDEDDWDEDDERQPDSPPLINWNRFTIVDKGYGWLRPPMDQGVKPAVIIRVIREMYRQRVADSRHLFGGEDDPAYRESMERLVGAQDLEIFLTDPIYTEWTSIAQLKRFSGAYIVGGGRNECLREVELLMNAFNIPYKRIDKLVYG